MHFHLLFLSSLIIPTLAAPVAAPVGDVLEISIEENGLLGKILMYILGGEVEIEV